MCEIYIRSDGVIIENRIKFFLCRRKKLTISVKKEQAESESEDESEDESKDETEKDEIIDIDDGMKIGADNLKARMPPPPKPYKIKASPYYLNNREKFINSILLKTHGNASNAILSNTFF